MAIHNVVIQIEPILDLPLMVKIRLLIIIGVVIILAIVSSLVILDKIVTDSQTHYTCFGQNTWLTLKGEYGFDGTRYYDNTCEWIDIEECYNENKSKGPFAHSRWDYTAVKQCVNDFTK